MTSLTQCQQTRLEGLALVRAWAHLNSARHDAVAGCRSALALRVEAVRCHWGRGSMSGLGFARCRVACPEE
jgi:hypothetical protein